MPTKACALFRARVGGADWALTTVPREVQARGIPLIPFAVGLGNTVQYHAQKFVEILETLEQKNPNLRCHIAAYSMGGLIMRYAANHLYVNHPTLGRVKASELMLSMTTMSTPHQGTPLPRVFERYFGNLDKSRMQMDEPAVALFNDPASPDYSPIIEGKPSYSYRTFNTVGEAHSFTEQFGFSAIRADYEQRGIKETRNDGIVPYASMSYGTVVGDIHAPHGFFDHEIGAKPTLADFFEVHWNYLHGRYHEPKPTLLSNLTRALIPSLD